MSIHAGHWQGVRVEHSLLGIGDLVRAGLGQGVSGNVHIRYTARREHLLSHEGGVGQPGNLLQDAAEHTVAEVQIVEDHTRVVGKSEAEHLAYQIRMSGVGQTSGPAHRSSRSCAPADAAP
jgi:hypothetical protein